MKISIGSRPVPPRGRGKLEGREAAPRGGLRRLVTGAAPEDLAGSHSSVSKFDLPCPATNSCGSTSLQRRALLGSLPRWAAAASAQKERTATAGGRRTARVLKIGCFRTWCSRQSSPTSGRRKSSSSSPRQSSRARTSSFTWRDRMLAPAAVAPWPRDRELQPGNPSRSLGAGVSPGAAAAAVASGGSLSVGGDRACWPGPARVTRVRGCGRGSAQIGWFLLLVLASSRAPRVITRPQPLASH